MTRSICVFALGSLLLLASAAAAQDWNAESGVETIQVVTHDEDGAVRDTTVWLAVHQGHGYIRTGGTKWGANVKRNPDVQVKIGSDEYPLRAVPIPPEDPVYAAVSDVYRQKYGFPDKVMGLLRNLGGPATIMRLDAR
jgi:hypothetical protein